MRALRSALRAATDDMAADDVISVAGDPEAELETEDAGEVPLTLPPVLRRDDFEAPDTLGCAGFAMLERPLLAPPRREARIGSSSAVDEALLPPELAPLLLLLTLVLRAWLLRQLGVFAGDVMLPNAKRPLMRGEVPREVDVAEALRPALLLADRAAVLDADLLPPNGVRGADPSDAAMTSSSSSSTASFGALSCFSLFMAATLALSIDDEGTVATEAGTGSVSAADAEEAVTAAEPSTGAGTGTSSSVLASLAFTAVSSTSPDAIWGFEAAGAIVDTYAADAGGWKQGGSAAPSDASFAAI